MSISANLYLMISYIKVEVYESQHQIINTRTEFGAD
jgi:hypothetical protein